MKIEVYEVSSGFANIANGIVMQEPSDCIYYRHKLELPDDWKVIDKFGLRTIWDERGEEVKLFMEDGKVIGGSFSIRKGSRYYGNLEK